ncbi:MAG: hypothetical protein GY754_21865 [bacterium]|nr:hypothetical protein [bacterium]
MTNTKYQVFQLEPSGEILEEMYALYSHGLAHQYPLTFREYKKDAHIISEYGIFIGIRDDHNNLIALRALLKSWKYADCHDKPLNPGYDDFAYLDHTVIVRNNRGSEISAKIAQYTITWLEKENLPGLRNSVPPGNFQNIGFMIKNGFFIDNFVFNLYGEGKHRFHGIYETAHPNESYAMKEKIRVRLIEGKIPVFFSVDTINKKDSPHMIALPIIENGAENNFKLFKYFLNNCGYKGILLLKGTKIWDIMEEKTQYTYLICKKGLYLRQ